MAVNADNNRVAVLTLSPKNVAELAAGALRASRAAFDLADRELPPIAKNAPPRLENPITASDLVVGLTKAEGQHIIAYRVGESTIGFVVPNESLRKLGRDLISTSTRHYSDGALIRLLGTLFVDFGRDVTGWGGVFKARVKAASRRRATSFWSIVSGRSFSAFRTIKISPGLSPPKYGPVGKCIYCDATVYSTYSKKPGIRSYPFGGEHIIPEGLGGTVELPEASCQRCEETTGAIVEGSVLGRTLKALRVHLDLKKSGSGPHPKSLPLETKINGVDKRIEIPIEDYPVVFMMVQFVPPSTSQVNIEQGKAANGIVFASLKYDQKQLRRKYEVTDFVTATWDSHMFCRMLAKIGHSFAVAELGLSDKFSPKLLDLIVHGKLGAMSFIGGPHDWERAPPSDGLHEMALGYQRIEGRTYLVVRVRLFARHGGPTYYVVVGESLESPIARIKRVLSNRISLILAR